MVLAHQTTQNQKHASQIGHFTRPGLSDSILMHLASLIELAADQACCKKSGSEK